MGTLIIETTDRRPALVWFAVAGLLVATVLAIVGMPPVDVHLPTHKLGIMLPWCGGTRSVARAAAGDVAGSWRYNPGGLLLVVGAWASVGRALVGRITGRWVNLNVVMSRGGWWFLAAVLAVLAANQQLHADLLA